MMVGSLVLLFIPFLTILIGNITIVKHIMKALHKRHTMVSSIKAHSDLSKIIYLTRILLTITFSYMLFTFPYIVYVLVEPLTRSLYEPIGAAKSAQLLWNLISTILLDINNSTNFLLYCIGGRRFRVVFCSMCGCKCGPATFLSPSVALPSDSVQSKPSRSTSQTKF